MRLLLLVTLLACPAVIHADDDDDDDSPPDYTEHSTTELGQRRDELSRERAGTRDSLRREEIGWELEEIDDELQSRRGESEAQGPSRYEGSSGVSRAQAVEQALARSPGSPAVNREAARVAMARGDFQAARARADAALKSAPGDGGALRLRAQASAGLGDKAAALADARESLRTAPNDLGMKRLVALIEGRGVQGQVRVKNPGFESKTPFEGGASDGSRPESSKSVAAAAPPGADSPPRQFQGYTASYDPRAATSFNAASLALSIGDSVQAATLAREAALAPALEAPAKELLARAELENDKPAEAAEAASEALDKDMDAALDALLERALSEMASEDAQSARSDAAAAQRINPKILDDRGLSELLEALGASPTAAAAAAARAGSTVVIPEEAPGILRQSLLYARQAQARLAVGDPREALRLCELALKIDGRNAYARIVAAGAYRALGLRREAVAEATRALRLQALAFSALMTRSAAYFELGDYRQAQADADAAIRINDRSAAAYRRRAAARRRLADEKGAIEDERRAEALEPSPAPNRKASRWPVAALAGAAGLALLVALRRSFRGDR